MFIHPLIALLAILATLLGVILKAYSYSTQNYGGAGKTMLSNLLEFVFLISLTIFWILIFSRVLGN